MLLKNIIFIVSTIKVSIITFLL